MNDLLIVIFFSLIGGVFSLVGGFLLLANKGRADKLLKYVTPFAAGALLAAAFTDVLTEASHEGSIEQALRWTLVGIVFFFLLERFIRWHHHRHTPEDVKKHATTPLIIIGDTLHNFLDGIAIAAAFLVDVPTGIVTTLAVAAHEIPQEIGDFGLLLDKGMSRKNVIKVNVVSALATTLAAGSFFALGREFELPLGIALGLVAGFFIYIAVSDIIPNIQQTEEQKLATVQALMLVVGVVFVSLTTTTLHKYIETESGHETSHSEPAEGHDDDEHGHSHDEDHD